VPYQRVQALQYAALYWNGYNPLFRYFPGADSANFVSQALWAGGMPMEVTGRRDQGWWYLGPNEQWSYSWAVVHSLRWYLEGSGRAQRHQEAKELEIGDVILYDWDGDDVWQHAVLVIGFDPAGEPLVAAHSAPAWGRPWRYTDSPQYRPNTAYMFFHVELP
jgi:hypothetical protein